MQSWQMLEPGAEEKAGNLYVQRTCSRCSHKNALGICICLHHPGVALKRPGGYHKEGSVQGEAEEPSIQRDAAHGLQIADEAMPSSSVAQENNCLWLYLGCPGPWAEPGEGPCVYQMTWMFAHPLGFGLKD